jgi:hypothetical protein
MGDAQGQGGLTPFVVFLDENHCRNPHLLAALKDAGVECQKHLDHFRPGLEDTARLPEVAKRGWCLLTTDAKIRYNSLERMAVRDNRLRMFYFSRNNLAGSEMGKALERALPRMRKVVAEQDPLFIASITRNGEVTLRDTFDEPS